MSLKLAIFIFALLFIILIGGIHFQCKFAEDENDIGHTFCLLFNAVLILAISACIVIIPVFYFNSKENKYNANKKANYEDALELNYNVFVNGSFIDGTKIDIKYYEMTINEDTKEVYLTPKN